jgi:hypothetical protein
MENTRPKLAQSASDDGPTAIQKEGRKLIRETHLIGEVIGAELRL